MKQVDLPLVSISTGLSSAMNTLRQSKRGALLSEHQGKYHLFTAGSIAVGRAKGVGTLAALKAHPKLKPRTIIARDIGPVSKMRLVTVVGARGSGSPRGKKENIRVGIRPSRSYILREISGKSAFLGVRSVNVAETFVSGPAAFYCDRPVRPHSFSPGEVSVGDPCPRLDGYTIVAG